MQCIRCNKKGLFFRVNDDGLCKKCEAEVAEEKERARLAEIEENERARQAAYNSSKTFYDSLCNSYAEVASDMLGFRASNYSIEVFERKINACKILISNLPQSNAYKFFDEIYFADCIPEAHVRSLMSNPKLPLGFISRRMPSDLNPKINELTDKLERLSCLYSEAITLLIEDSRKKEAGITTQSLRVTGVQHYEKNICKLGHKNLDYDMAKRDIIDSCMTDEKIWKQIFDLSLSCVQLIPEPDNPHDSNAIKVVIDGQHVGYIWASKCKAIHDLIDQNRIESIFAEITGGPYKVVNTDYNDDLEEVYTIERDKDDYSIVLTIEIRP